MIERLSVIEAKALLDTAGGKTVYSGLYARALRRVERDHPNFVTIAMDRGRPDAAHFDAIPTERGLATARATLAADEDFAASGMA